VKAQDLIDGDEFGRSGELSASQLLKALQEGRPTPSTTSSRLPSPPVGGEEQIRQMERGVLLNVVDQKWREHLYEMDYLKEGIGLRAMAQRDPLVEYQREGGRHVPPHE
jgi:preprotein translocase subunit SecA